MNGKLVVLNIENMPLVRMKEMRKELVAQAKHIPHDELAARYVQARTDSKMRDEKLAEQGARIADLEAALSRLNGHPIRQVESEGPQCLS